jgi:hypothetical protein
MSCIKCGGTMVGDGYTSVIHCEFVEEDVSDRTPDSGPIYCNYTPDPEPEPYRAEIGECRLAFRSEDMWEVTLYAVEDGARITRFEGTLLEDGYTLASLIVWQWPNGEVEKVKEEDFLDVSN